MANGGNLGTNLALELDDTEVGDLSLLEWGGVTVNGQTPGQKLAAKAKTPARKTRSGNSADFESKHPRGRGGTWTVKAGAKGAEVERIQRRVGGTKADGVVGAQTAAAMRGAKDAKNVKPGQLTKADRAYLSGAKPKPAMQTNRSGNERDGKKFTATKNARGQHVHRYKKNGKTTDIVVKPRTSR